METNKLQRHGLLSLGEVQAFLRDIVGDDELYEITCPACNNTITADFDVISSGAIDCPNCGEKLEFDLSALEDCDCCE